jgi:two-component system chemotaxis response regulator CheB
MKVLIVDDSLAYRSKIRAALSAVPWIEVVGSASNGKIALEMIEQKGVDLATLDMEMPVLDGISTLKALRQNNRRTKVIVFSSSTTRGSEATLDALAAGADDFVAKPASVAEGTISPEEIIRRDLLPKIEQFVGTRAESLLPATPREVRQESAYLSKDLDTFIPSAIVIASSTGGPTAHDKIFGAMGGALRCPILIAQHMPPVFTAAFAKRLSEQSGLPCKEGVHGELVKEQVYVAPGDYHMTVKADPAGARIQLDKQPLRNSVRPAADFLFESAVKVYGAKCMGFVLTGMGEDGLAGAKALKAAGAGIMIQNQESCVVFGMPGAVFAAGALDAQGNLEEIRLRIKRMALK